MRDTIESVMNFFFCQRKLTSEIIFDIGSGSIAGSIVVHAKDQSPYVVYTYRASISHEPAKTLSQFTKSMVSTLELVADMLLKRGIPKLKQEEGTSCSIEKISCFYSSPWFISQTKILRLSEREPIVFTQSLLDKIIHDEEKHFAEESKDAQSIFHKDQVRLVEKRITRIRLNGYETHEPFGKQASTIEVSLFLSALSKKVVAEVEEALLRTWRGIKISHHSFALAAFAVLRNMFVNQSSFVIVDVSGEMTDVSFVHDGMLLETLSYPMGRRAVIRKLSQELSIDYGLAKSILALHLKGELHSSVTKIESVLASSKKDWLTHLEHVLATIVHTTPVPPTLYLLTDADVLPFFESTLTIGSMGDYVLGGKNFRVISVKDSMFESVVRYKPSANKDFFLAVEALYGRYAHDVLEYNPE